MSSPSACRGGPVRARKDVAYRRVDGVDPNLLSLDAYVPHRGSACGPAPVVVYVHGGGFVRGDKANKISDKVRLFTDEGWTFVSVDYRLSPRAATSDRADRVRYPTHEQDVAAAVAWVEDHARELGGDPARVLLMGHSSGAFLVSLLSTDLSFLTGAGVPTDHVRCTVALDTEYDVARQVAQGGTQEQLYRNAFGDDPATWRDGSPVEHIAAGTTRPSFLVVTRGPARRVAQARDFVDALEVGGTHAALLDVSPMTHEEVNAAVGSSGDSTVTPAVMAFLRSCR
jgi:acetyl esterase/lipase